LVADFTIDSQILHYASLPRAPLFDKQQSLFYLTSSSLPLFINPTEWKLDLTDSSTQPLINFILFVPAKTQSPLHIKNNDGSLSKTNAFSIPQWGGIVIYNPDNSSKEIDFTAEKLRPVMQLFVGQLRDLLGVNPVERKHVIPAASNGIAQWEVDALIRKNLLSCMNSSISTLQSLSTLVQNLTNMVVLDNIGDLCFTSLNSLTVAMSHVTNAEYDIAHQAAKGAVASAEEAFFDPKMLAMLYFPDDHKYAVYALPFFPVCIQLLKSVYEEWKLRKEKKNKNKKKKME